MTSRINGNVSVKVNDIEQRSLWAWLAAIKRRRKRRRRKEEKKMERRGILTYACPFKSCHHDNIKSLTLFHECQAVNRGIIQPLPISLSVNSRLPLWLLFLPWSPPRTQTDTSTIFCFLFCYFFCLALSSCHFILRERDVSKAPSPWKWDPQFLSNICHASHCYIHLGNFQPLKSRKHS